MKQQFVLQAQDIAMLDAVHRKLGTILEQVNGKPETATAPAKKRGPKPGSKRKAKPKAPATDAKKYDPTVIQMAEPEAAPAS